MRSGPAAWFSSENIKLQDATGSEAAIGNLGHYLILIAEGRGAEKERSLGGSPRRNEENGDRAEHGIYSEILWLPREKRNLEAAFSLLVSPLLRISAMKFPLRTAQVILAESA